MQHAEKLVAILVQRLGGRVEISPHEIDRMGDGGELLVGYRAAVEWMYVLEVREPGTVELPLVPEDAPKASMDIIGLDEPSPIAAARAALLERLEPIYHQRLLEDNSLDALLEQVYPGCTQPSGPHAPVVNLDTSEG